MPARMCAVLAFFVLALFAGPSAAQWETTSQSDATGAAVVVMRGVIDPTASFEGFCQGSERQIWLILQSAGATVGQEGTVDVSVANDVGGSWEGVARYVVEVADVVYVIFDSAQIEQVVGRIVDAKSAIYFGMRATGASGDYTYSNGTATGSTRAGRSFLERCGLTQAASPAPAQPAPAAAGGAWTFSLVPDEAGANQAMLVGDLDQGGYFYAYCGGNGQPGLAFVATNPATFPYEAGDVGLMLRVEIDGDTASATGEHFSRPDGVQGILYTDPTYLENILIKAGAARTEVAMMIESYSSGLITRWPAKNLTGLADGMAQFRAYCFDGASQSAQITEPPPPAATAPEANEANWRYESSGTHLLLADHEGSFSSFGISCSDRLASIVLLSRVPGLFGIGGDETSIGLIVRILGQDYPFTAVVDRSGAPRAVLIADAYADVATVISALMIGETDVTVIVRASGRSRELHFPAAGQGAALRQFYAACYPDGDPAAGTWVHHTGADAPDYAADAVLLSPPHTDGAVFVVLACGGADGFNAYLLSPNPAPLPGAGAAAPALSLTIDETTWSFEAARPWVFPDSSGLRTTGSIVEIIGVISLGPAHISATLSDPASGQTWTYDFGTQGANAAAMDFFSDCLI